VPLLRGVTSGLDPRALHFLHHPHPTPRETHHALRLRTIPSRRPARRPASAETHWSAYGSFANTRCEDAGTIADILEALNGLSFNEGGRRTFAEASHVEITRSTTLRATANFLDCRIRVEAFEAFEAFEGGATNVCNARDVFRIYLDRRWTTQFHPHY
jgi:hypothetical protein